MTAHRITVAEECIGSGLFETLQFPFSYISSDRDIALAEKCKAAGMGYIAMKGLAGGLITNVRAAYTFMKQYDNVVPIWGIQKAEELEEWLRVTEEDPDMDEELAAFIRKERQELSGTFCRSCGYCMPCPQGVNIPECLKIYNEKYLFGHKGFLNQSFIDYYQYVGGIMGNAGNAGKCNACGKCLRKCPQKLDIIEELKTVKKEFEVPGSKYALWLLEHIGFPIYRFFVNFLNR